MPKRCRAVLTLAACLQGASCAPPEANTVPRFPPEIAENAGAYQAAERTSDPSIPAPPRDRLRDSATSLFVEGPFSLGAIGGLGNVVLSNGTSHLTGDALHLSTSGAIGPRLGLSLNHGYLFTAATYDYSLLFGEGGLHHATATLGGCIPGSNLVVPFLGVSLRVWDLSAAARPGEVVGWDSGVRASAALDGGLRITPWRTSGKRRRAAVLFGPVLRASAPIAGGGGWVTTANLTLGGGQD